MDLQEVNIKELENRLEMSVTAEEPSIDDGWEDRPDGYIGLPFVPK